MKQLLFILFFCSNHFFCQSQVDTSLLRKATELFSTGDYEQSLAVFQKTLTQALQNGDKKRAIRDYIAAKTELEAEEELKLVEG